MQFQVTEIEFDFDDSGSYDKEPEYFQTIIEISDRLTLHGAAHVGATGKV